MEINRLINGKRRRIVDTSKFETTMKMISEIYEVPINKVKYFYDKANSDVKLTKELVKVYKMSNNKQCVGL